MQQTTLGSYKVNWPKFVCYVVKVFSSRRDFLTGIALIKQREWLIREDKYIHIFMGKLMKVINKCVHKACANKLFDKEKMLPKIVSEYDQEIPQTQTADNTMAPRGRAAQPSRDTRKTN